MSNPFSFGELEFNLVGSLEEGGGGKPEPETPFRLLVMGDFSGRTNRGASEPGSVLASLRPLEVDRDNFDDVLKRLGVRLRLDVAGEGQTPFELRFQELEDFHPDQLYSQLEIFHALRHMRRRLSSSSTFDEAAREMRSWARAAEPSAASDRTPAAPAKESPADAPNTETTSDLIAQMLSASEQSRPSARTSSESADLNQFLREIVGPHLVADIEAEQEELIGAVDSAVGELMRSILHHPDFQSLEAAWRSLHFLVSRVETDTNLKLYLLDISQSELDADLRAAEDLRRSALYKLLVEQSTGTLGGDPWAAVVGNYTFDETRQSAELLGRIARIARQSGAPFIAGASPRLVGADGFAQTPDPDDWRSTDETEGSPAWASLRRLPEAAYLGLALPRFLLRLPYGEETEPTDSFDFEEMPGGSRHESYLWGNAALACAYLLADAFTRSEWEMQPGDVQQITDLPLHIYEEDGESQVKPCAEILLGERAVERILDAGLMAFVSFRGQDEIRLVRFQSLALPPTRLAGRWS
ncbi:MAG TPA: type VI secretion system contractile sheath large subunit [Pyrinomonadaceae bacterium]|jgi:type VI secretion system protein ImpC